MARKPYISKIISAALGGGQSRRSVHTKPFRTEEDIPIDQLLNLHQALPQVYEVLSEVKHAGAGRYELKCNVCTLMNDAWWLCQKWKRDSHPEVDFSHFCHYDLKQAYHRGYEQTLLLSLVLALLQLTSEGNGHTQLLENDILSVVKGDFVYYPRFKQLYAPDIDTSAQQLLINELQQALAECELRIEQLQRNLADARNRADQEERALSTQTLLRYLDVMPQGEKVVLLRALSYMEAVAKGEDAAALKVLREAIEADVKAQMSLDNTQSSSQLPSALSTPEAMCIWQRLQELGFVDENYQRLPSTTRSQTALIAELFAEHCGITSKWATFERLWNINNLAQEKQNILNTGMEPQRAAEIYEVFE